MPNPVVQRSPGKTVIQISEWIVDSGVERGNVMQIYISDWIVKVREGMLKKIYISDWIVQVREGMLCKYIFLTG